MDRIADIITLRLIKAGDINQEDYAIYKHGLQVGMEIILWILSCLIISFVIGSLLHCIYIIGVFISLRSYLGGIHFNNYRICYFFSCFVVSLLLIIGNIIKLPIAAGILIDTFLLVLVYCLSSLNANKKNEDREEYNYYRTRLKINCILIGSITIILSALWDSNIYSYLFLSLTFIILSANVYTHTNKNSKLHS